MSPSASIVSPQIRSIFAGYSYAITLLLVVALTSNFLFASSHDLQRCIEIAALGIMALVFLVRASAGQLPAIPRSISVLLTAFLALGLVSAWNAFSFRHAAYEWSSILLLLVLIFAVSAELARDPGHFRSLLHWTGMACCIYSLRVLVMYAALLSSGYPVDVFDLVVGFSNPRFLNHTQTALMPLIVLLCLTAPRSGVWRKLWFTLAAFWWALLFVTEARATILALSVACATALVVRRSHARQFVTTMLMTALTGIVLYVLLFILLPEVLGLPSLASPLNVLARTATNPASDRILLWKLALHLIQAHPWLGVGPQHFAHEGARLYAGAHPHDWLLQISAEWGIPAMLCLLATILLGARGLARSGARLANGDLVNQQLLVTLQVACMAIFVDALFSGVLVMPQSQLAISLVLGMAYAWHQQQSGAVASAGVIQSAPTRAVSAIIVAAGLSGLIWSVAPDLVRHARGNALTPAELAANPAQHWSRMWETGYF